MSAIDTLGDTIIGWFVSLGQAVVDMLLAIPRSISSMFESWGEEMGVWYMPILVVLSLGVAYLMFMLVLWVKTTFME